MNKCSLILCVALMPSCAGWFSGVETTEATIAKSVGAEHTTNLKILSLEQPDALGTLNLKFKCGKVERSKFFQRGKNSPYSEVVFTRQFARKVETSVEIGGINKAGSQFNRKYSIIRSKLSEKDNFTIDPNQFIEYTSLRLATDGVGAITRDDVIEVRVEYILDREKHPVWLGYLTATKSLHLMIPRPSFNKSHKFFRVKLKVLNVSEGKSKLFNRRYDSIPSEIIVSDQWFEETSQAEEKMKQKMMKSLEETKSKKG